MVQRAFYHQSIVGRAGQAIDSALTKTLGSSANPTPPCYHQHCPFRRLRKLIADGSSGPMAIHPIADAASLGLGHRPISSSFQVNHLIDKGRWWRLATSNFSHLNAIHFLLTFMSLNAIGHDMEAVAGPERFLMVYAASAIASQAMSYRLNKTFSVGASGPICGLVLGLSVRRFDNWAHVGGFLGGAATSWLLDPAGKLEYRSSNGWTITINIKGREKARGQP